MSDASPADHIAVIGCGVLGTSLCRQLLESPDFADRKGRTVIVYT
jgi:pyrroline-5-carboxylate reductase